jgi:hypothetical protein
MANVIFYSGVMQLNGEIKLVRRDEHIELNPAPQRVDIIIQDKPIVWRDPSHYDPTLTVFYEPKDIKHD